MRKFRTIAERAAYVVGLDDESKGRAPRFLDARLMVAYERGREDAEGRLALSVLARVKAMQAAENEACDGA
jgi:hypothetical protein